MQIMEYSETVQDHNPQADRTTDELPWLSGDVIRQTKRLSHVKDKEAFLRDIEDRFDVAGLSALERPFFQRP
jgi:hypothetical protein